MEDATKKKRGRPSLSDRTNGLIDSIAQTDFHGRTPRTHANIFYEIAGSTFVIEHKEDIPNADLLAWENETPRAELHNVAKAVLEQLGRMLEQDSFDEETVLIVARYASSMIKGGYTVKQTASWIKKGRKEKCFKEADLWEAATNISLTYAEIALATKSFEILRGLLAGASLEKERGEASEATQYLEKQSIDTNAIIPEVLKLQFKLESKLP